MSLAPDFDPFVKGAPCAVLARLIAEWLLDEETLKQLFDERAQEQYERELTLANLTNVMLDVSCGIRRSPRAAFLARFEKMVATLSAFYQKLAHTEPAIGEAIVEHTAILAGQVIRSLGGS